MMMKRELHTFIIGSVLFLPHAGINRNQSKKVAIVYKVTRSILQILFYLKKSKYQCLN